LGKRPGATLANGASAMLTERTRLLGADAETDMNPYLIFICLLAGMVLVAFVVSRVSGARAQYLETFALAPGERVLWDDLAADAYKIAPQRALVTSYRRSRRRAVRVTNLRILAACTPLFGNKHLIEHLLYPSDRPFPEEANGVTGGLFTRGYTTLVFERGGVAKEQSPSPQFIDLLLSPNIPSSINTLAFRIYSDRCDTFCLPE
jgi:hypothetical protein